MFFVEGVNCNTWNVSFSFYKLFVFAFFITENLTLSAKAGSFFLFTNGEKFAAAAVKISAYRALAFGLMLACCSFK